MSHYLFLLFLFRMVVKYQNALWLSVNIFCVILLRVPPKIASLSVPQNWFRELWRPRRSYLVPELKPGDARGLLQYAEVSLLHGFVFAQGSSFVG